MAVNMVSPQSADQSSAASNSESAVAKSTKWPKWLLILTICGVAIAASPWGQNWVGDDFDIREWSRRDYFIANLFAVLILICVRFWPTHEISGQMATDNLKNETAN